MALVSSSKLRPFIEHLLTIYENIDTLSSASDLSPTLLNDILNFNFGVQPDKAQFLADFLLDHRRVKDKFATYEISEVPRHPTQKDKEESKKMERLLRSERRKYGW